MTCENCGYEFKEGESYCATNGPIKDTEQGPKPAVFCGEGCWKQWVEDIFNTKIWDNGDRMPNAEH